MIKKCDWCEDDHDSDICWNWWDYDIFDATFGSILYVPIKECEK
jgi:hypothetical protein